MARNDSLALIVIEWMFHRSLMMKQTTGQADYNKSNNNCRDDARAKATTTKTRCGAPVAI